MSEATDERRQRLERTRRIAELLDELLEPENVNLAVQIIQESERGRDFLARFLVRYCNETRSDALLEEILDRVSLPWYVPTGIVRRLLDAQLPEAVVTPIVRLLLPNFPNQLDPYELFSP